MELRYFDKHFVKNARKKGPAWRNFRVFCPRYSYNYILDTMNTIRWIQSEPFFQNQSTFFDFQKREAKAPLHPSCAPRQSNLEVSKNL